MTDKIIPFPHDAGRSRKPATEVGSVEFGSPFGKSGRPRRTPAKRQNAISETMAKLGDLPVGTTLTYEVDDDGTERLVSLIVDGTWIPVDPEARVGYRMATNKDPAGSYLGYELHRVGIQYDTALAKGSSRESCNSSLSSTSRPGRSR